MNETFLSLLALGVMNILHCLGTLPQDYLRLLLMFHGQ